MKKKCISATMREYEALIENLPDHDFAWRVEQHRKRNQLRDPDPASRLWARICERELALRGKK